MTPSAKKTAASPPQKRGNCIEKISHHRLRGVHWLELRVLHAEKI
jgi:hypothetical protein